MGEREARHNTPLRGSTMDIGGVFDWFARESMRAAEQSNEWRQREMFLRLALMWATAAQQSRKEASRQPTPPRPTSGDRAA